MTVLGVIADAHAKGLSKDNIKRAMRVSRLHRAFSYPGLHRLKSIVRHNQYGFDILPSDVDMYFRHLHAETCLAYKLGKTLSPPQLDRDFQRSLRPGLKIIADALTIKSDLLKINFLELVGVDEFSAMTHLRHLESKNLINVQEAFRDIIKNYIALNYYYNFVIYICDDVYVL